MPMDAKWIQLTDSEALLNVLATVREWCVNGVPMDWKMTEDDTLNIANFIDCQLEWLHLKTQPS